MHTSGRNGGREGLSDQDFRALSDEVNKYGWTEAVFADDELEDIRWSLVEAVQALSSQFDEVVVWGRHGMDGPYVGDLDDLVAVLGGIDHALAAAARLRAVIAERRQAVEGAGGCWDAHIDLVRRYRAETARHLKDPGPIVEVSFEPAEGTAA